MANLAQPDETVEGAMHVYLCTGRTVRLRSVSALQLRDDKIVCRDEEGVELATFLMAEVYMCSRGQVPVAPL